jgi:integrase
LGPWPELGLGDARRRHAELRAQVLNGLDPLAGRRSSKTVVAKAGVPMFGAMALDFVEVHEPSWRNGKHRRQWRQTLTQYCGPIRDMPIDQVTTVDVLACLKPVWARAPETGSRLRGRIESVIDAARALGHIPEDKANPARWKGHLDKLLPKPAKLTRGHYAAMPYNQLPEFVKRLRASPGMAALALEFLILTASRSNETLRMTFDKVDLVTATLVIPGGRMKTKEEHSVPLCDRAAEIVAEARRMARKEPAGDSFVFPGARPKKPLSNMAFSMILKRMGIEATAHGFRSSFRMWCSEIAHAEFEVAEACLSHRVGSAVSRAYNRTTLLERRRPLMQAWAAFVTGKTGDNVIELRRAGA